MYKFFNITFKPRSVLRLLFTQLLLLSFIRMDAQVTVSGTVFDISKVNYVENVRVVSSAGIFAVTDSMGKYSILVTEKDSLTFIYNNKPTQTFPVASIQDTRHFDISIRMPIKGKYSVLKEVTVFAKTHKEDSLENRQTYADVFEFQKPGVETSVSPDGSVGADVNQLINIFRFRRNKRMKAFQQRLEQQEQDKYVDYRFNKLFVRRITGLQSPLLDTFMIWYRPDYEFARISDEITFNQYILNASYHFKKLMQVSPAKLEDE